MKRVFILKGLDCPNCSAKIEKEVGALPGVESSVVNLMQQTLTVQSEKSADATLAEQVEMIVHSHEPDVEVSEKQPEATAPVKKEEKAAVYNDEDKKRTIRLAVGAAVYAIGMALRTSEICFRKISFAVSNFVCVGCCPVASKAAFSRSSFSWPRLRAQYSASLTRSFEPLSRSIWYSPAPSHSSMTSTRRCRMVWAVLECFMPSRQSRGFCI